jgi:hypothetical protein
MKYITLLCLLISYQISAQEANKKRPSWSQGLPERQASVKQISSMYNQQSPEKPVIDDPIAVDLLSAPDIDVDIISEPILVPAPELTMAIDSIQADSVSRKDIREQYYNNDSQESQQSKGLENQLVAQYKWQVLSTTPIQMIGMDGEIESLELIIHINPEGHVIKVAKADASISSRVLQSAEQSIRNWRFQPPAELGIKESISKTFTIDIQM